MSTPFTRRRIMQGATAILMTIFALSVGTGGVAVADTRTGLLQFSADGLAWLDSPSPVPGWKGTLVPGNEINRTYYVRNNDALPGEFTVQVGEFSVSEFGIFTVGSDVDGVTGSQYVYYGSSQVSHVFGPEVQVGTVLARVLLAPGQSAIVTDRIGIPAEVGNETRNQSVTPAIGWDFLIDEEPVGPDNPDCGGTGSLGSSGSVDSAGSIGSFGSLGGTGSFKDFGSVVGGSECDPADSGR